MIDYDLLVSSVSCQGVLWFSKNFYLAMHFLLYKHTNWYVVQMNKKNVL